MDADEVCLECIKGLLQCSTKPLYESANGNLPIFQSAGRYCRFDASALQDAEAVVDAVYGKSVLQNRHELEAAIKRLREDYNKMDSKSAQDAWLLQHLWDAASARPTPSSDKYWAAALGLTQSRLDKLRNAARSIASNPSNATQHGNTGLRGNNRVSVDYEEGVKQYVSRVSKPVQDPRYGNSKTEYRRYHMGSDINSKRDIFNLMVREGRLPPGSKFGTFCTVFNRVMLKVKMLQSSEDHNQCGICLTFQNTEDRLLGQRGATITVASSSKIVAPDAADISGAAVIAAGGSDATLLSEQLSEIDVAMRLNSVAYKQHLAADAVLRALAEWVATMGSRLHNDRAEDASEDDDVEKTARNSVDGICG